MASSSGQRPEATITAGSGAERWVDVDLDAIADNVAAVARWVAPAAVMAVVKADAYGHGDVQVARAALRAGADTLGVAHVEEALKLRRAGIGAPVLAWLHTPRTDMTGAVRAAVDLGVSSLAELHSVARAVETAGGRAGVHLKVDTGLGRNGASPADLDEILGWAAAYEAQGRIEVKGMMSHLSAAEDPEQDERTRGQARTFVATVELARRHGIRPHRRHIANTAAALRHRELHFDMVRLGLGTYGLSPLGVNAREPIDLRPALSVSTVLSSVRVLPAGHGISYGAQFVTSRPTRIGLVPLGYGDGLPRTADGMSVLIGGATFPVRGRIAMDQLVVDLGPAESAVPVEVGDTVTVLGGSRGQSAARWAQAAATIPYEVVTGLSVRGPRLHSHLRAPDPAE